jgi:copper chaperone CopZ
MKTFNYFFLLLPLSATAAPLTYEAQVNGMVCAFCAQGIEKSLRALPQTQDVYVNLPKRLVALELKDGQTLAKDQFTAIIKDAGYDVVKITDSQQSAAQLKQANKK